MDIDLLKTFIEVYRTRHFGKAAENLFITQSAASARVRLLEEKLGVRLFVRIRNNIQLTPAGQRLLPYAESLLTTWLRASQDIALEHDSRIALTVSGVPSLWDILLQDWLVAAYGLKDIVLNIEAHPPEILHRRLLDGAIDLAFTFEPPRADELDLLEVASVSLIMISGRPDLAAPDALAENYVFVDWGTSFSIVHARSFPDAPAPSARVSLGRIALSLILELGGTAYMAEPMVHDHLREKRLFLVRGAPVIERVAYAVSSAASDRRTEIVRLLALLPGSAHTVQRKVKSGPDGETHLPTGNG